MRVVLLDDFSPTINQTLSNWNWQIINGQNWTLEDFKKNKIQLIRKSVSKIVGRNTLNLNKTNLVRASIESLGENTSDGIIAPIFWGLIFGLPGIALYKTINTLDSMIGYKNNKYLEIV